MVLQELLAGRPWAGTAAWLEKYQLRPVLTVQRPAELQLLTALAPHLASV